MKVEQIIPVPKALVLSDSSIWNKDFVLNVYDDRTIEFLNSLSKNIFSDPILKNQPQFVALAFWLRKSNVLNLIKRSNIINTESLFYTPIGVVFHVCPSNVDTMFVYSLAISLLMGNKNILRISKRNDLGVISNLFNAINNTIADEKYSLFSDYISVITYGHEEEINNYLSFNSDARIIWGGDNTISSFKRFKTAARSKDVVFADRISLALFSADSYSKISEEDKYDLAKKFYNDTYMFDQKGCSSPQAIIVMGDMASRVSFKENFYKYLNEYGENNYQFDEFSIASLKLNNAVADIAESVVDDIKWESSNLWFSDLNKYKNEIPHSCGAGYFYIVEIKEIHELKKFINKKTQTLTYFGFSNVQLVDIVKLSSAMGVDRIVPVGSALDFDFMWDGYNLFEELSSKKALKF